MKQFSTGTGVAVLGVCILAAAVVATHRTSGEAFAQATGGERRIVAQGVYSAPLAINPPYPGHWGYRVWSDNVTEVKFLGTSGFGSETVEVGRFGSWNGRWQVVDAGTGAFFSGDVDRSGQVDTGDVSAVLLDFGSRNDETPPPPIDCAINAPR